MLPPLSGAALRFSVAAASAGVVLCPPGVVAAAAGVDADADAGVEPDGCEDGGAGGFAFPSAAAGWFWGVAGGGGAPEVDGMG